jgi:type I restriction enzyme S subunit
MRMHHGLVLFAEHFTRPPQAATLVGFKIVQPGQFVVNRMQAGNGVIYASTLTGLVSPDYAVLDPIGDANVEFLESCLQSKVRAKFRAESKGLGTDPPAFSVATMTGLAQSSLCHRDEQAAIWGRTHQVLTPRSINEREISLLRSPDATGSGRCDGKT